MANIILPSQFTIEDKLKLMKDDALFDVSDDSGEVSDKFVGKAFYANHSKVPKVFLANDCAFNCAYCGCRFGNDEKRRYCNTPKELAKFSVNEAASGGRGVFISSAIYKNADYTQELIIETLKIIRNEYQYKGYVHAKVMPGTDPMLIEITGKYADRLSVNIEVAQSEGYKMIAKQKNKRNILTPMGDISALIKAAKKEKGMKFARSQTTQLMAGSTNETDRTIMVLSKALYKKYDLKRVYYTSFQYKHHAQGYDLPITETPKWRMHRLYQADRLMTLYGFGVDDVSPEAQPNLQQDIDPKADWALRNLDIFPIEVNTADFEELIKIPGIGLTYAEKIIKARQANRLDHQALGKMGVPLKKSTYFLQCDGKYQGGNFLDSNMLRSVLAKEEEKVLPLQLSLEDLV